LSGVLRFTTAGSVDDGKSTLIGRLLVDTQGAFEDQVYAATRDNEKRGGHGIDFALLTDGLKAEREQGITIDVAYRYFSTPRRKFIIADAPGHEQYTRNMITAASTVEAAVILVDVQNGVTAQSRQHACIAHLMGIQHLIIAVNKMDLAGYERAPFERVREEFSLFLNRLGHDGARFIPLSALRGDMVVERGHQLSWYTGPALLETLESLKIDDQPLRKPFRMAVQLVNRPPVLGIPDFRGYMGRVISGRLKAGQRIMVLPSRHEAVVDRVFNGDGTCDYAGPGDSITVTLDRDLDVSRGDLLTAIEGAPAPRSQFDALLCWMSDRRLKPGGRYMLRHTTRLTKAVIPTVDHRVDIHSLNRVEAGEVVKNDIAYVKVKTFQPLACEAYRVNRGTGAFILIDDENGTAAAGMIQ